MNDLRCLGQREQKKNRSGINRVQLFIPGKIVHLVDTSGNGNYVPHWARKEEFNQLEISKRMYTDHDIHSLVAILRDIRLGGENTVSLAFHNAPLIYVDEDDSEVDVRLFSCCSNPYGKLPIILWLLGLIATSVSAVVGVDCDFVRVSGDTSNRTFDVAFGIFSYQLLDCDNSTGTCDKIWHYMDNAECVPYPPKWEPGGYMQASRIFLTLVGIFGSIAMLMLLISMCFIFKQRTWRIVTALLVGVTLFQGLTFLIVHPARELCSEHHAICSIGADAINAVVACCIWILMVIGSGYLAKVGKRRESRCEVDEL